MNIIPGAVYLGFPGSSYFDAESRPDAREPYIGHDEHTVIDRYGNHFEDDEGPDFFPQDLTLLYAPGDEVLQLEREWIHPTRMLRREGVVTEIYRSADV